MGNQPSLLGNPPFHLLMPQNVPNRPVNPVYFGNQFDSNGPPPVPPHMLPNVPPNQFPPSHPGGPPHTPVGIVPHEPLST